MSKANLRLGQLFAVSGKELATAAPVGFRLDADATVMKEELSKLAKGIPWSAVKETIGEKVAELLDVSLLDVISSGWKKLAEVMEYADTAKYPPRETSLVPLVEHKVKSEHHPYIEVLVKGSPVGKVQFDIQLTLTIEGLVLRIENAMIKSIQAGTLKGKGSIALGGSTLAEKSFPPCSLPGTLHLGNGIPLTG